MVCPKQGPKIEGGLLLRVGSLGLPPLPPDTMWDESQKTWPFKWNHFSSAGNVGMGVNGNEKETGKVSSNG